MMPRYALRVIAGPTSEPVSLAELRAHTRVDGSDDDALVAGYLLAARQHVEHATGRALSTQSFEMTFAAFPDGREFDLPVSPVQSVTSIQYQDGNGALQTLSGASYVLDGHATPARIALASGAQWPTTSDQIRAVTVIFVAGYVTTAAVPESLRQAIMLLAAHFYENRELATDKAMTELPFGVRSLISTSETNWL